MTQQHSFAAKVQNVDSTRSIEETVLSPGESTTVEVTVDYGDDLGEMELVRITDEFSPAFANVEIASISPAGGSGGSGPDNDEFVVVWNEDADSYSVSYEVTLPAGASREYTISGTLEIGDAEESLPTARINEGEGPSIGDYAADDGFVELNGLNEGINDWRTGDINLSLLRDVIDAWRRGEPVE